MCFVNTLSWQQYNWYSADTGSEKDGGGDGQATEDDAPPLDEHCEGWCKSVGE